MRGWGLSVLAFFLVFTAPLEAQKFGAGGAGGGSLRAGGMGGRGGSGVRVEFRARPGRTRAPVAPGFGIGGSTRFGRRSFFSGNGVFVERGRIVAPTRVPLGFSGPSFAPCPAFRLARRSGQVPALLVFGDGSIYEVENLLVDASCIHYRTTYGGTNTVPLAALNREETRKRNAARGIIFDATKE